MDYELFYDWTSYGYIPVDAPCGEESGDRYVLIDSAPPGEGVPEVAEGYDASISSIPDIPALEIPLVHPADTLALIEAAQ